MVSLEVKAGQSLNFSYGIKPLHVPEVATAGQGASNNEDGVPVINSTDISGERNEKYWHLSVTFCSRESYHRHFLVYHVVNLNHEPVEITIVRRSRGKGNGKGERGKKGGEKGRGKGKANLRFGFLRLSTIKKCPHMLRLHHRELRNS